MPAFFNSWAMIIATEIGDKTFFIAAVLSMKRNRMAVFAGAFAALILMTILSSMMGLVLPNLLPRKYTHIVGGMLFLYFGVKLIYDGYMMEGGKCSDELDEVEEELVFKKNDEETKDDDDDVETQSNNSMQVIDENKNKRKAQTITVADDAFERVFTQALTLTFLAEWGDRSQIATIALAANQDPYGVTAGGILGHGMCTGLAVAGGRMLAASISEKSVNIGGGGIFLLFGIHSLFFER
jgi:putative Ca2+/H+ antiporter (TMEM165/GDT1 family)